MSMISEQVKELREKADYISKNGTLYPSLVKILYDAADTIEALSAKVAAANMERSEAYYNGGWIPCSDRLPEKEKFYIVTYRFNDEEEIKCHELYYGVADYEDEPNWYLDDDYKKLYKPFTVIAWQPLPEQYKPGK